MQPRRVDGGLRVHPAVDRVDDHLDDRGADPVRAGGAEHELRRAVVEHDRRRHHRRQPAAGRMREPARGREVLLAHHVVDVDAGARHDEPGALAVGGRHRARPAVGVEHRDVGRRAEPRGHERSRGSPARRGPSRNAGVRSACAASIASTIASGAGGPDAALEQRERVRDQDPARARRRVGQHLAAVVADVHRLARDGLVGRRGRACVSVPPRLVTQSETARPDVAGVERRGAVGGQARDPVGEVGIADDLAGARHAGRRCSSGRTTRASTSRSARAAPTGRPASR